MQELEQINFPIEKEAVESVDNSLNSKEPIFYLKPGKVKETVSTWLEQELSFHVSSIYGVDEEDHIDLFYYIYDREGKGAFLLAEKLNRENPVTQTISDLVGTVFYEGEATEMFGIKFENNPITQVFLPETWDNDELGYPLRKDWVDIRKKDE